MTDYCLTTLSRYLNQRWLIVNKPQRRVIQCKYTQASNIFINKTALENVVYKIAAILYRRWGIWLLSRFSWRWLLLLILLICDWFSMTYSMVDSQKCIIITCAPNQWNLKCRNIQSMTKLLLHRNTRTIYIYIIYYQIKNRLFFKQYSILHDIFCKQIEVWWHIYPAAILVMIDSLRC